MNRLAFTAHNSRVLRDVKRIASSFATVSQQPTRIIKTRKKILRRKVPFLVDGHILFIQQSWKGVEKAPQNEDLREAAGELENPLPESWRVQTRRERQESSFGPLPLRGWRRSPSLQSKLYGPTGSSA